MNNSPYQDLELDVTLPHIGQTKAIAHYARNQVMGEYEYQNGISHISFPVDAHLNEPDLKAISNNIAYLINESDPGEPVAFDDIEYGAAFAVKNETLKLKDEPLYQVVMAEKLAEVGVYDLHESAILTQNPKIANALISELNGLTSIKVQKKNSELTQEEIARVTNNIQAAKFLATINQTLDRYGIERHESISNADELIMQSLSKDFPHFQNEVKRLLEHADHYSFKVSKAIDLLTVSNEINKIVYDDFSVPDNEPASPSNTMISINDKIENDGHGNYIWERETGEVSTLSISAEHGVSNVFNLGRHTDLPRPDSPTIRR